MSQHGYPERLSNRSKGFQDEGQSQHTMEVLVETLTGTAFEMTVSPSDTIFAIKSKIFRVEGIPVSQQHLLYNLKELEDGASLAEHRIGDGARLRLVLGMSGGPVATRRLPPPEPWHDLERLVDTAGEDVEWGGNGCKVTVLVFREGERVNMVRVRENRDGSYSPIEQSRYSPAAASPSPGAAQPASGAGAARDNALTATKMMDLRRRMESLSVRRRPPRQADAPDIQKTRSEENLSTPGSSERYPEMFQPKRYQPFSIESAPVFDYANLGNQLYDYDCPLTDRYSLLPPIGTRTDSESSIPEAVESERLSSALAGPILVKGGRGEEEGSVLGECLDRAKPERLLRQDPSQLSTKRALAPIPAAEYSPAVGGEGGWRSEWRSSAAGDWRPAPAPPRYQLSASTPQLDRLPHRLLPALSRHRNREHLHLSDERLEGPPPAPTPPGCRAEIAALAIRSPAPVPVPVQVPVPAPAPRPRREKAEPSPVADAPAADQPQPEEVPGGRLRCQLCRRRLSVATLHVCRCGGRYCAPHRYAEVHRCFFDYRAAH